MLHQTIDRLDVSGSRQERNRKHGSRYLDHLWNEGLCHEVCGFLAIGSEKLVIVNDVCQNGIVEELGAKWNSIQGSDDAQIHPLTLAEKEISKARNAMKQGEPHPSQRLADLLNKKEPEWHGKHATHEEGSTSKRYHQ